MRKNFYLSGLFLCILALCVCGCGGGGSAADPMGTGTVQFVDGSGSVIDTASVVPNGTITLRAKVTNLRSDGTSVPVVNEKVSFSIVNTGNGASLTVVNDRTASGGLATVLFTSGNSMYSDVVRMTTEVGATATIHINKTGGLTEPGIKTLTASNPEVVAGQTSVITANVVDGTTTTGSPVMGVLVRFRLPVNNSGASFSDAYADGNFYAYTDVGGNATAVYQAGDINPAVDVYDTVLAELENGSSMAVEITRKAGTTLSVLIDGAEPDKIVAGQASIITATVSGDDKAGAIVTFSAPVNNSGGCFISPSGACVLSLPTPADQNGEVVALYRGGSTTPGIELFDTIRATLTNGSTDAIGITRIVGTIPSGATLTLVPSPSSVNGGETSVITATVTGGTSAGVNETVTLIIPANNSGGSFINAAGASVLTVTITTGSGGTATAVYRAGTNAPGSALQDTIQGVVTSSGAINACTIARKAVAITGYTITVMANPLTLPVPPGTGSSTVTATVRDNFLTAVSGATVNFAISGAALGALSVAATATNAVGNATTTYTGNGTAVSTDTQVVTATATLGGAPYSAAVIITYP